MSSPNPTPSSISMEKIEAPIAPIAPVAPVAPIAPVAPVAPVAPTAPLSIGEAQTTEAAEKAVAEPKAEADNTEGRSRESSPSDEQMPDTGYQSSSASEYEPPDSPEPTTKPAKFAKLQKVVTPKTPKNPKPRSRIVKSGRVEKSNSPAPSTLKCPVQGCGQTFTGRNPRQSLWHHLKYYSIRGLPNKEEFEAAHGVAHTTMKEEAEPKGTPVERNRLSSSDYRKKNPEKAKTSARLANFSARARKKGLTNEKEIQEKVAQWEKEWQDKQAKEASEYFSSILLSAFE
jgi:hypothetical protein